MRVYDTFSVPAGQEPDATGQQSLWRPSGVITDTFDRRYITTSVSLVSGTLRLAAIVLRKGMVINHISFLSSGTALATPTHQWFCLVDQSTRNVLAVTSDDTTTAWATNSIKTLNLTSTYTETVDRLAYVGINVTASTPNNLSTITTATTAALLPLIGGTSSTGGTTPPTVGTAVAALTAASPTYAYLS